MKIDFYVNGLPAPQGSKRHVGNGVMVESSKSLPAWRECVSYAARKAAGESIFTSAPVSVVLFFYFPMLKGHYHKDGRVRDTAPHWKSTKPDIDKLMRAVLDAMSGVVFRDDSQVARAVLTKTYSGQPGVFVEVTDDMSMF
jgi:crossover junction endodeoxyribonuclease RusA